MITENINLIAEKVINILNNEGAVRGDGDDDAVGTYITVRDLCERLDLYVGDWGRVKQHMLNRGFPLCYTPGKGHYLGGKGEEIKNTYYKWRMAKGWSMKLGEYTHQLENSSHENRYWLQRSFEVTSVQEMEAQYADRSEQTNE